MHRIRIPLTILFALAIAFGTQSRASAAWDETVDNGSGHYITCHLFDLVADVYGASSMLDQQQVGNCTSAANIQIYLDV